MLSHNSNILDSIKSNLYYITAERKVTQVILLLLKK